MGGRHSRRDVMRAAAVLAGTVAAGGAAPGCTSAPDGGGNERGTVLRGATVIDATGAPPRPGSTVVVTGDRITAVGRDGEVDLPPGHEVVELDGAVVLPGLCDMHVHLTDMDTVFPPLYLANGVTTIRVMAGEPFQHTWRDRVERGELLAPRMVIGSPILDGRPTQFRGSGAIPIREIGDAAEARAAVTEHREAGADFLKVYSLMTRPVFEALAAEARRQDIPVLGHCPDEVPILDADELGMRTMEHLYGWWVATSAEQAELQRAAMELRLDPAGEGPLDFHRYHSWYREVHRLEWRAFRTHDARKAADVFAALAERGTSWQVPTVKTLQVEDMPARPPAHDERPSHYPEIGKSAWWPWLDTLIAMRDPREARERRELFRHRLDLVGAMHAAGVPILAGSDDSLPTLVPGFALHDELALLVEAGLSPMDAIRAATVEPARYLGVADERGTVEVGKAADLLVLRSSPLDAIANTRDIRAVVVRGRLIDDDERTRMLDELRRQAADPAFRPAAWTGARPACVCHGPLFI